MTDNLLKTFKIKLDLLELSYTKISNANFSNGDYKTDFLEIELCNGKEPVLITSLEKSYMLVADQLGNTTIENLTLSTNNTIIANIGNGAFDNAGIYTGELHLNHNDAITVSPKFTFEVFNAFNADGAVTSSKLTFLDSLIAEVSKSSDKVKGYIENIDNVNSELNKAIKESNAAILNSKQIIEDSESIKSSLDEFMAEKDNISKAVDASMEIKEDILKANTCIEKIDSSVNVIEQLTESSIEKIKNTKGMQGIQGERGEQGKRGPAGKDGINGSNGINGKDGPAGNNGPRGENGPQGPAGPRGPQGIAGPVGPAGADGRNLLNTENTWKTHQTFYGEIINKKDAEVQAMMPLTPNAACYYAFYKNTNNRSGYFGYESSYHSDFVIANEVSGANINLKTCGGKVQANGKELATKEDLSNIKIEGGGTADLVIRPNANPLPYEPYLDVIEAGEYENMKSDCSIELVKGFNEYVPDYIGADVTFTKRGAFKIIGKCTNYMMNPIKLSIIKDKNQEPISKTDSFELVLHDMSISRIIMNIQNKGDWEVHIIPYRYETIAMNTPTEKLTFQRENKDLEKKAQRLEAKVQELHAVINNILPVIYEQQIEHEIKKLKQ